MDINVEALQSFGAIAPPDPSMLLAGIALIAVAVFVIFFLKRVVENIILGIIALLVIYVLGINIPLIPTFVVTLVFGLAGVGAVLILHFMGLI